MDMTPANYPETVQKDDLHFHQNRRRDGVEVTRHGGAPGRLGKSVGRSRKRPAAPEQQRARRPSSFRALGQHVAGRNNGNRGRSGETIIGYRAGKEGGRGRRRIGRVLHEGPSATMDLWSECRGELPLSETRSVPPLCRLYISVL